MPKALRSGFGHFLVYLYLSHPNPVSYQLTVTLPDGYQKGHIFIFTMEGQLVSEHAVIGNHRTMPIDMTGLAVGTYSVESAPEKNKERQLWTNTVVKID